MVTSAVAEEGGTIDKFIGDCVMALWGAPTAGENHVFRACVAALKAHRRMERLNASWAAEGRKQMRVRSDSIATPSLSAMSAPVLG